MLSSCFLPDCTSEHATSFAASATPLFDIFVRLLFGTLTGGLAMCFCSLLCVSLSLSLYHRHAHQSLIGGALGSPSPVLCECRMFVLASTLFYLRGASPALSAVQFAGQLHEHDQLMSSSAQQHMTSQLFALVWGTVLVCAWGV